MRNNFNLTQNMQISMDTPYVGVCKSDFDRDFERISQNYEVHRKCLIKDFMKEHYGLLEYLEEINPIVERYFLDNKKGFTFSIDPEFSSLNDVVLYIRCEESSFDENWKKLDELQEELFYISNFSSS